MIVTKLILSIAKSVGVPGSLLLAICTHESNLDSTVIVHDNGSPSYGLCQIKFDTAKSLGFTGDAKELMIPKVNVKYSALYLKMQLDRYGWNWCRATASYNSGTYNPSKFPNIPRNIKYVNHIINLLDEAHKPLLRCGK
jgi:soluble lytic murein transglycosylase-like protein